MLDLSAHDLLTTTRAVRRRLDLTRPVPPELIRECVATALQAPSGSNNLTMQFVVVTDEATRRAIGEVLLAIAFERLASLPKHLPVQRGLGWKVREKIVRKVHAP